MNKLHGVESLESRVVSQKNKRIKKSALICVLLIFSCVYSFSAGSFGGTVSIPPLENKTQNPDISRILTEGLIDAFISDGRVKIETGLEGDYLLEGVIDKYERLANSYTPAGEIEEYNLSVNVSFSLKKKEEEKNEWSRTVNESFVYSVELNELDAVDSVAVKIKNSLLRFMLEQW
jgi:outer membrane lipopolysaccharide assembly protein LptE/RlpB